VILSTKYVLSSAPGYHACVGKGCDPLGGQVGKEHPSTRAESDLSTRLEGLFREVSEAHHQAYIETDGADPEWPLWYAGHLRERLGALLNASFTKSELVYLLILVANEQPLRAPRANWSRYYAKFFLGLYL
jgi:hypothetical protein